MIPSCIQKLLKFIQQKECRHYLDLAHETFFMEFCEENNIETFSEIKDLLGEAVWSQVYPCALEFFFSNDYLKSNKRWNVIDLFLKKQGKLLETEEKDYLGSLRESHMSLYKVIDIRSEEGLTLRDLLEEKEPIQVHEKSLTHQVKPKQILGARILNENGHLVIAGGCLPIDQSISDELIEELCEIHAMGLQLVRAGMMNTSAFTTQDNERLLRVMWAKEIGLAYMNHAIKQPSKKQTRMKTSLVRRPSSRRRSMRVKKFEPL